MTIFSAACTTRSRTAGIDSARRSRLAGFDEDPTGGRRTVAAVLEVRGQLVEQPVNPVLLDIGDGGPVDAGRAAVAAHRLPRALQHVPAVDLVIERVEPSPRIGLGRPVERSLQFSNLVCFSGLLASIHR